MPEGRGLPRTTKMTYPPTFDLTFTASPGFGRHCNACGTGPGVVRCSAALSPKADIVIYLCDDCAEPRITNTTDDHC